MSDQHSRDEVLAQSEAAVARFKKGPDAPAARAWAAAADEYTRGHAQELGSTTVLDAANATEENS